MAGQGDRKLTAILSADVVGYSRLMGDDERATVQTLKEYRGVFRQAIEGHKGRVVDAPGDNLLAEFPSAVEAVSCAALVQDDLRSRNSQLPEKRQMHFRIGINVGDVISEDGALFGDGVNVAARLEALADSGGICISGTAFDHVKGKVSFALDYLGEQDVKNIEDTVRAYRVALKGTPGPRENRRNPRSAGRTVMFAGATAAMIAAIVAIAANFIDPGDDRNGQALSDQASAALDTVLALPDGPSIAVLPFSVYGQDEEQRYFADSILDNLITELTRSTNLFVSSRHATYQFKNQAAGIQSIGRTLNARYILEGSMQRGSNQLRITVTLSSTETGTAVWSEKYERDMTVTDLFSIQDEIVRSIVGAVGGTYGAIYRADVHREIPTENLIAYDFVVKAIEYWAVHHTEEEHVKARDLLEKAVELDPEYALGWAYLTWGYLDEVRFGYNPLPNSMERARAAAQKAVKLAPLEAVAHWALAAVYFINHEVDKFLVEAERAIELNPNEGSILNDMGAYMIYAGHVERGYALVKKAVALNPQHPNWWQFGLTAGPFGLGDYETALNEAHKLNMSGYYWQHAWLATLYGHLDRKEEGRQAIDDLLAVYPDFAENVRRELRIWNNTDEAIEKYIIGLRKAGLEVPDEPVPTN
jgi:adenylate cyclase